MLADIGKGWMQRFLAVHKGSTAAYFRGTIAQTAFLGSAPFLAVRFSRCAVQRRLPQSHPYHWQSGQRDGLSHWNVAENTVKITRRHPVKLIKCYAEQTQTCGYACPFFARPLLFCGLRNESVKAFVDALCNFRACPVPCVAFTYKPNHSSRVCRQEVTETCCVSETLLQLSAPKEHTVYPYPLSVETVLRFFNSLWPIGHSVPSGFNQAWCWLIPWCSLLHLCHGRMSSKVQVHLVVFMDVTGPEYSGEATIPVAVWISLSHSVFAVSCFSMVSRFHSQEL